MVRFAGVFGLLILGAAMLNRVVPRPLSWSEDAGELLYAGALAALAAYFTAGAWERLEGEQIRRTLKSVAAWTGIFLAVSVGYSYRFELASVRDRVLGSLIPGIAVQQEPGIMRFPISSNGHFYIRAKVEGVPVQFLADTGATDIVLSPRDARRLGYDLENLRFDRLYQTANGPGRGASVRLRQMEIGSLRLRDVGASVNRASMNDSLLGMSFFNRLKGYSVEKGLLTIQW